METKYKITIPKPCHEDWDKMTAHETGRFCNCCAKNVVDFTVMNPGQVQDYFAANKNKSICGKFRIEQLHTLTIRIPEQIIVSQFRFHNIFLLALLITMGTTLLSCSDKNGEKQKIDKVEIVTDNHIETPVMIGESSPVSDSNNMVAPPPPPPSAPKIEEVKFTKPTVKEKTKTNATDSTERSRLGGIRYVPTEK